MEKQDDDMSMGEFLRFMVEALKFQATASKQTDDFTSVLSALQILPFFQQLEDAGYSEAAVERSVFLVKDKLDFIVKEGLLDPFLAQLLLKASQISSTEPSNREDKLAQLSVPTTDLKLAMESVKREKIACYPPNMDIVIHVIDDARGEKRDFTCSSQLLLSAMPYFARAVKGQDLNDVDISVHCDLKIFDWLLKWMKKEDSQTEAPFLDY